MMELFDYLSELGTNLVAYPADLCPVLGGVQTTVLLCQIVYWKRYETPPDHDVCKSQKEIAVRTGLSDNEQATARKHLRRIGVLTEHYARFEHRMYYRVDRERINQLWNEYRSKQGKTDHQISEVRETYNPGMGKPISRDSVKEDIKTEEKEREKAHKGDFAQGEQNHRAPATPNQSKGKVKTRWYLKDDESLVDYELVKETVNRFYSRYQEEKGRPHPKLKEHQLALVYESIDTVWDEHDITDEDMARDIVDRYWLRGLGKADGNLNAFAHPGMLTQLLREMRIITDD